MHCFHLQYEYLRRLDYQWKRQLKSEQVQASITKLVNRALLQNILPLHVGKQFINICMERSKWSEQNLELPILGFIFYSFVALMK